MKSIINTAVVAVGLDIVSNIPKSSILIFDHEMRYIFAGGEELEKANYSSMAMIGKTLDQVIPAERAAILRTFYQRALNKEKFQTKITRGADTYLSTFSYIQLEGKVYGMAINQNITDLVTTEQQLNDQKELYENVLQAIAAGVWYWPDMTKPEEEWSERYYELLGYEYGEIPATIDNFVALIHPEDRESAFSIQKETPSNAPFYLEYRIKTKSKGYRWFLATGMMIADEKSGVVKSMLGSIIDIDDRKKAESEVKAAEMKLASIFNNSFELIGLLTPDGRLIESNNIALDFFGEPLEDLRGKYLWEVGADKKPPEVQQQQREAVEHAQKGGTIRLELHYIVDGEIAYQDFSIKPVKDLNGQVIYLIAETRDITEMVVARKNLEEQKFQLENFAYITSHNLRAPAANINMLVGLLEYLTDEADKKDIILQIDSSAKKLIDTISILAEVVKIRKEIALPTEPVDLMQMLKMVKDDLSASIISSGAVIEADFAACPTIDFPIAYMESIFSNMLTNSIKYASPERKPHINIKTYMQENRPVLEFADNGIGIDLEKHGHKIFGLYKVFTKHSDAHGVGLYLVKNQIESQGGKISVKSTVDKGTTFIIQF